MDILDLDAIPKTQDPIQSAVPNQEIEDLFPDKNKKYRLQRKILSKIFDREVLSAFVIAKCIHPKLNKRRFKASRKVYMKEIKNRIRGLNRKIDKRLYYFISQEGEQFYLQDKLPVSNPFELDNTLT